MQCVWLPGVCGLVFQTGMVGYVESLTDPSYCHQILTLTYPLIGNYGVPNKKVVVSCTATLCTRHTVYVQRDTHGLLETFESERIHAAALVVGCHSDETSHWEAVRSLSDWMKEEGVPGISGAYHMTSECVSCDLV